MDSETCTDIGCKKKPTASALSLDFSKTGVESTHLSSIQAAVGFTCATTMEQLAP